MKRIDEIQPKKSASENSQTDLFANLDEHILHNIGYQQNTPKLNVRK